MASTAPSISFLTSHISAIPTSNPIPARFAFPISPLKPSKITLPAALHHAAKPLSYEIEAAWDRLSPVKTDVEEEEVEAADDGFYEIEHGGICAVPKKRRSRSKSRIRRNIWKGKARIAAAKAYSLARSIATGNSKSFLVISKSSSSSTSSSES
ncbi:unnamed protein product [Cuscuta campestris]|uniref:Large ribosomal subunit protein bL32c n=2 Tax=Cuscuta sect. Cleistogrammica TaxID=1824901 RepID=A0A484M8Y3_9ASTE|nr:hypothetical protein DM860_007497 [Cuscuta australis]VFQ84874.1 unnamed protein product [Cuscuta campestris]